MIRWLSFSSDRPSFTAGHIRTGATSASTGPVAVADSSGLDFPEGSYDRRVIAPAVSPQRDANGQLIACYYGGPDGVNCRVCGYCRATYKRTCDHRLGVWCACSKQVEPYEDDPDVMHEGVYEETY